MNLFHTLANAGHRFEVVRLIPSLNFVELVAHILSSVVREISYGFQRIAEEAHGSHTSNYIQLDIENNMAPGASLRINRGTPTTLPDFLIKNDPSCEI